MFSDLTPLSQDTSGGWSDEEEEYDFNIDNFFYFMFG